MKVLVTAGPTREAIDPVRFVSNRSSGKMGYAVAEAARRAGHAVRLISGPVAIEAPFRVAIRVVKEMPYDGEDDRRDAFQSEVIAHVFEECTPTEEWIVDDLLLQLFDQKSEEVILRAMDQAGLPFVPAR